MKLKIDLRFLLLFLCTTLFIACSSDDDSVEPTLSITPNKTSISFTANGGSETFTVDTNQDAWKAESNKSWCKVTTSKDSFTVTAEANTSTTAPEEATITVSAGSAKSITIKVSQGGVGAELSISPEASPITFEAEPGEVSYTFEVTTNQGSWNVESSQKDWCIVSIQDNKFTISAYQNLSTDVRTANVTVSAGNAANITIEVTQKADNNEGGEGETKDDGLTIWEDTHWRLFQLKGNPKSVIQGSYEIKFNASGKVTSRGNADGSGWTFLYEYDNQGRITKHTEINIPYNDIEMLITYKYGDHSKYVPSISLSNIQCMNIGESGYSELDYLLKGIIEINIDGGEKVYTFNEEDATLKAKNTKGEIIITYSGDYPILMEETYYDSNGEPKEICTKKYSYGNNYKYKGITVDGKYKYDSTWSNYNGDVNFIIDNTIYHLPSEYGNGYTNNKIEYDEKGRISKFSSDTYSTTYSDYKEDSKGNWIERTVDGEKMTRTITYY